MNEMHIYTGGAPIQKLVKIARDLGDVVEEITCLPFDSAKLEEAHPAVPVRWHGSLSVTNRAGELILEKNSSTFNTARGQRSLWEASDRIIA